jgi:hypothetical protein
VIAVSLRRGAQRRDVGAAAGFGDGERRDLLAAQHGGHDLVAHGVARMQHHRRQADVVREQAGEHAAALAVARERDPCGKLQRIRGRRAAHASG